MKADEVRQALADFITALMPVNTHVGKVKSVEGETCTVTLEGEKMDLFQVRLRASINGKESGIIITPAVGSYVLVSRIEADGRSHYVSAVSEIDGITINGGQNHGLVKVSELTEKLNALEQDLNDLKTAFKSWVTVPNDGGAALKAAAATWAGQNIRPTQQADIENNKVKH